MAKVSLEIPPTYRKTAASLSKYGNDDDSGVNNIINAEVGSVIYGHSLAIDI